MLNLIFFLVVAVCGAAATWFGHSQISDWEVSARYGAMFICFLALLYVLSWLNFYWTKKELIHLPADGQNGQKKLSLHACLGHVLFFCSALMLAYGLEAHVFPVFIGGVIPAALGADLLFKQAWQSCIETDKEAEVDGQADYVDDANGTLSETMSNEAQQRAREYKGKSKRADPYADAKVAAPEIIRQIQSMLKTQEGRIRMESVLCALGSLAGYACQRSLLMAVVEKGDVRSENISLIKTEDGTSYFDGVPLNYFLIHSSHSLWELALANVRLEENVPELDDILAHTAQTMGTPEFGIPRLLQGHRAPYLPVEYVKMMWPTVFSTMRLVCSSPHEWPVAFGFAIQKIMDQYKDQLELGLALNMVMECAIPMSRVNLFDHFSTTRYI